MAPIRMLALDVDGTLAARGDEVTPATREALHRAAEAGVEVVLATGRRYRSAARVVDTLALDIAIVCLGGALVKEHDRSTLHRRVIAKDEVAPLIAELRELDLTFVGQRDAHEHGGADFVIDGGAPWSDVVDQYVTVNAEHAETRPDLADRPPDDVLAVGTFGDVVVLERMCERLAARHAGRFETTIVPSPSNRTHYLEIIRADVSKWSALEHLAGHRGIRPEQVCAVGDQRNDLSMIRGSGMGVAMGNGADEVKAAATWVCGRHDEDGLVQVVAHILGE